MSEDSLLPMGFTRRANPALRSLSLDIERVTLVRPIAGLILSHDMVVREVHFLNRRTIPHNHEGSCEGCAAGRAPRATGYLAVKSLTSPKISIFEIPCKSTFVVEDYFNLVRTLRGHEIKLTRVGNRTNGRVHIDFVNREIDKKLIPECPNVIASLCKMWGMIDWQTTIKIFAAGNVADPQTKFPIERQA